MLKTILSIAGKPGLFKLISRGRGSLIVESLDENKRRMPAFATDKVISLGDIAMYTDNGEVPLRDVLNSIKKKEGSVVSAFDYKKASGADLANYFAEILPDYDRDRVHMSDIKKLIAWYNILIRAGITNFDEDVAPTEGDNIKDRIED